MNIYKTFIISALYILTTINPSFSLENNQNIKFEGKPKNIPKEYLITPGGNYIHPQCITTVDEGETINSDNTISLKDGSLREVTACEYDIYNNYGNKIETSNVTTEFKSRHPGGWEAAISHNLYDDNGITKIVGEWVVPANPFHYEHQTLYLFNSIRMQDGTIIQPVLSFNELGTMGPQWTISSWMVKGSGVNQVFSKSNSLRVNTGDIIRGTLTRDIPVNVDPTTVKKWRITTSVVKNGIETSPQILDIDLLNSKYSTFDEAVYETYGGNACAQISSQYNLKQMRFTFSTPHIVWRNGFSGPGNAYPLIFDHTCGVKTHIDKSWTSEIYYGTLH